MPFHRSDTEEMYNMKTPEDNFDSDSYIDDNEQTTKKGRKKDKVVDRSDRFDPPNNEDEELVNENVRNKKKTKKHLKSKSPQPVKKSSHPTSFARNQVCFL